MRAPEFSLQDQNGRVVTLDQFKGSWLLLYFYPKDDTPGCTREACNFRDSSALFNNKGINIVGVSKDSVISHTKFTTKYNLNFPLLSDESKEVIKAYGAWGRKKFMGKEYEGIIRKSYLINPEGEIVKSYEKVNPLTHAKEILEKFEAQL